MVAQLRRGGRCVAFSVIVTHESPDRAGEVAEAFAKLTSFMADALGGRGMASGVIPYRHGHPQGPIVGYRFLATIRGTDYADAEDKGERIRHQLAEAGRHDGQGCNFTFGQALLTSDPWAEELAAKLGGS